MDQNRSEGVTRPGDGGSWVRMRGSAGGFCRLSGQYCMFISFPSLLTDIFIWKPELHSSNRGFGKNEA